MNEAESALLDAYFRSDPAPVFLKDVALRFVRCNEAFRSFLGLGDSSIIGRGATECCPSPIARAISEVDRNLLSGGGKYRSNRVAFRGGPLERGYLLDALSVANCDGGLLGVCARIVDAPSPAEPDAGAGRLMRLKDAILAISRSTVETTDDTGLFDLVLEKLLAAIDHASVGCVLRLEEDRMLHILAARGYPRDRLADFRVRLEDTFQWKKTKGHLDETLIINNLAEFMPTYEIPGDILRDANGREIHSSMSAPLFFEGALYGLINLDGHDNDVFDDTDRTLMEYVRAQIPIALGIFKLNAKLREMSRIDPLTNLLNRRALLEAFDQEKRRASRNG